MPCRSPNLRAAARALLACLLVALMAIPDSQPGAGLHAAASSAFLVKELNTGPSQEIGSSPHNFLTIGATTYFVADDGSNGAELWRTDGAAGGTRMLKDIVPGPRGSQPRALVSLAGTLFFAASDGDSQSPRYTLWTSDGTTRGTVLVAELGSASERQSVFAMAVVGPTLLILVTRPYGAAELWRSDGTPQGTVLVKSVGSARPPLVVFQNALFFVGSDAAGDELWRSDGTPQGTGPVKDINPGASGSGMSPLVATSNALFFTADDGSGVELWKSDGTPEGTVLVKERGIAARDRSPRNLTSVGEQVYYTEVERRCQNEMSCVSVDVLWRSDGTDAGTLKVADLGDDAVEYPPRRRNLADVGGRLFFANYQLETGWELWTSDGTEAGTRLVQDINPGPGDSAPAGLTRFGDDVFFAASTGTLDRELWRSDGTAAGTTRVKDINRGDLAFLDDTPPHGVPSIAVAGSALLFGADDGSGLELWRSDGSSAGTRRVKDINPGNEGAFDLYSTPELIDVNGTLFFTVVRSGESGALWRSDGTVAGTTMIRNFPPASPYFGASYPRQLTNVNGTLFFVADGGDTGNELWKSDGTPEGTALVKDVNRIDQGEYARIRWLTNVNGTLFFAAHDGQSGHELWRSDGTEAGTRRVKDINPGYLDSVPGSLTVLGDTLYFTANDALTGLELWRSDGTEAGTFRLADINPGLGSAFEFNPFLTAVNDTLFFIADNGSNGNELWTSDGTAAGTRMVKDIKPGVPGAFEMDFSGKNRFLFSESNRTVFFVANDGTHGRELWKSDGSPEGTVLVMDIHPDPLDHNAPWPLAILDGALLFAASDAAGRELWRSDGTPQGTYRFGDIYPGPGSPSTSASLAVPGQQAMFLNANDGTHGIELWRTDGTAERTVLVQDIAPGVGSSRPHAFAVSGAHLFFVADDNTHGPELWALPLSGSPAQRVALSGPATTVTGAEELFTAAVTGAEQALPISYTWELADRPAVVQTGGLSATLALSWTSPGTYAITVTARSAAGTLAVDRHAVTVLPGAQAVVTPDGGALVYSQAGGELAVVVPPGAVGQAVVLRVTPDDGPQVSELAHTSLGLRLSVLRAGKPLAGFSFARPATMTITYPDALVEGLWEEGLIVRYWNGATWLDASQTCEAALAYQREGAANRLVAPFCATGVFRLAGPQRRTLYVPLVAR